MKPSPASWRILTGVFGLLVVTAVLLSTPGMVVAKSIAIVDTELRQQGDHSQRVLVKLDLGKLDQLHTLPKSLGRWNMTQEHEWDDIAAILNTNVLLSRDYARPGLYQAVNLLIVQSTNVSSFHPAPVCYRVQGWEVSDEGRLVAVPVPNATWAQESWISDTAPGTFNGSLTAKVLEAQKTDPRTGAPKDKRVAVYVYLKKSDWAITNEVTWVRAEIAVPPDTDTGRAAEAVRDLLAEVVPHLFDLDPGEDPVLGQALLNNHGALGAGAILALVSVPSGLIVAGIVRRGK